MKYELALKLKEAGFPSITRWEVENNYHRRTMVNGDEMLPLMGAILSEIKIPIGIEKTGNKLYSIYYLHEEKFSDNETYDDLYKEHLEWIIEKGLEIPEKKPQPIPLSYRDDHISHIFEGDTPEIVLALFYIEMKNNILKQND